MKTGLFAFLFYACPHLFNFSFFFMHVLIQTDRFAFLFYACPYLFSSFNYLLKKVYLK